MQKNFGYIKKGILKINLPIKFEFVCKMANTGLQRKCLPEKMEVYENIDADAKELIKCAIAARKCAYCPYSNFKVGAAFLTKSGEIYKGCNIENAGFAPSVCAERVAIGNAICNGAPPFEFTAGAVVAYQEDAFTTPCGVCRQVIMEFAETDIPIFVTKDLNGEDKKDNDEVFCTSIYNLLPHGFRNYKKD